MLPLRMSKPPLGEYSLSALVGAMVGSIGGLFAIGLVRAVIYHNIVWLLSFRILGLLSFLICGGLGWVLGGQIGPRLGELFDSHRAELLGGTIGGLIPVLLLALWAWHMTPH
jgi:hypothetical protein